MLKIEIKTSSEKEPEEILQDLTCVENELNEQMKVEMHSFLHDNVDFQSSEFANFKISEMATELYDTHMKEVGRAIDLFQTQSMPEEREQLSTILSQIVSIGINSIEGETDLANGEITENDLNCLEGIARRVMLKDREESACLYKFILLLDPGYPLAWIGLAICYQEMGFQDVAEQTYEFALQLSSDYLLQIYAAEFFIIINKNERAMEILNSAKNQLINENKVEILNYIAEKIAKMIAYLDTIKTGGH